MRMKDCMHFQLTKTPSKVTLIFMSSRLRRTSAKFNQSQINKQIDVLNTAYNPHGISFVLRGSTIVMDELWAGGANSADMMKFLHRGTLRTLNIFIRSPEPHGS